MTGLVSTLGGGGVADFETAVTKGFADDGGLFVPESIPRLSPERLQALAGLGFIDLAFEILSLFIRESDIPRDDLRALLTDGYRSFEDPEIAPVVPLGEDGKLYILELFHGPTLSFKDMAMGFLINTLDYFLQKRGRRASLLAATTGDTGPAAAHASAGKETIDCWVMYPKGMISEEQERQLTTLEAPNVHAVGVSGCRDGGDDLDLITARMFGDEDLRRRLELSSVNSINWGRVLVQSVHYFYAYFRTAERVGDPIAFSVPTGAFGNMFGGFLARSMGLPVHLFICANNRNAALARVLTSGVFTKADLIPSASSAIDIVVPYNLWRYLYFAGGRDPQKVKKWMDDFSQNGRAELDQASFDAVRDGLVPAVIDDAKTFEVMARVFRDHDGYLLDPHTAVAVAAAEDRIREMPAEVKTVCLATAHPAKFPEVVGQALGREGALPSSARHPALDRAAGWCQWVRLCDYHQLPEALIRSMTLTVDRRAGRNQGIR